MQILKNFGQFINENFGHEHGIEEGAMSDCCGAQIVHGGHCSSCGEKCEESYNHMEEDAMKTDHMGHTDHMDDEDDEDDIEFDRMYEAKKKMKEEEEDETEPMPKAKKKAPKPEPKEKSEKPSRTEVLKTAKEKFPNLKPAAMKKGLSNMKGKDFKTKAKKNFGWADSPSAAAAAYIRKATGKEPRDI